MNHSIYSADRTTHLKIVVIALVAGIAVAGFGISARTGSDETFAQSRVIKAGAPVAVTNSNASVVR
jgi:chromosome condensin MukBEF MukE localization factor